MTKILVFCFRSQLTTANTQCQQVTAQLVAQAHDIDKQVAKFEAQIQVMTLIAAGAHSGSENTSTYGGLFGAQRLMVEENVRKNNFRASGLTPQEKMDAPN